MKFSFIHWALCWLTISTKIPCFLAQFSFSYLTGDDDAEGGGSGKGKAIIPPNPVTIFEVGVGEASKLPNAAGSVGSSVAGAGGSMFPMKAFIEISGTGGWFQKAEMAKFVLNVLNLLMNKGIIFTSDEERKKNPFNLKSSDDTIKTCPSSMGITSEGESLETILSIFEYVINISPHRAHPFYLKRDAAGLDPYAVIGEILSVTVSAVVEIAGKGETTPLVLAFWFIIQKLLVTQIRILIGYTYGDGVPTAGPCISNIMAVKLAIDVKIPGAIIRGFSPKSGSPGTSDVGIKRPVIFISEGNVDGLTILGLFSGIPEECQVKVNMDKNGRMDPEDLEKKILEVKNDGNKMPLIVIATLGTTNLGAVDPISKIADITEKYDMWLHIDGTHGSPCIFSASIKEKWAGIERSNSMTFSFSTLLGVPQPSSFLIVRNDGIFKSMWNLEKMWTLPATHIKSQFMQTPRFTDPGKTWFMWLIKGYRGLRQHVEYSFNMTQLLRKKIEERPKYVLLTTEIDTPVVPFRVIPSNLKDGDENDKTQLDEFTKTLKSRLLWQGFIYVTIKRRRPTEPYHFIFPLSNSILTESDMDYILETIDCQTQQIEDGKSGGLGSCPSLTKRVERFKNIANSPNDYMPYVNAPMPDFHLPFFLGLFKLIIKVFLNGKVDGSRNGTMSEALNLGLTEFGMKQKDIAPYFEDFALFFKKTFNFNPTNFDFSDNSIIVGLLADYTTGFMSPTMESREAAPPFVAISDELSKFIRTKIGYPKGEGDGVTIPPDGALTAQYTIAMARYKKQHEPNNESKDKPLVLFVSKEAHHTWMSGAGALGIGFENCEYVGVDSVKGQLDPNSLRKAIQDSLSENKEPLLVVGTLGTDVLGAIDPLDTIADISNEFGLWFHVDGRNGGPLIFSTKQQKRLKGIDRSDSFSFSSAKFDGSGRMNFVILVTKHKTIVKDLFGKDDDSTSPTGSRTSDEFKYWTLLKSDGTKKTGDRVDKVLAATQAGVRIMKSPKNKDTFKLILPEFELVSICFLYKPKGVKEDDLERLDEAQIELEVILRNNEIGSVYYTNSSVYQNGQYGFLKIDVGVQTEQDLEILINKIVKFGQEVKMDGSGPKVKKSQIATDGNQFSTTTTTVTTVTTTTITKRKKTTGTGVGGSGGGTSQSSETSSNSTSGGGSKVSSTGTGSQTNKTSGASSGSGSPFPNPFGFGGR